MVLSVGSIDIALRLTAKKHECDPIYCGSSLSLIVLFQRESLSELVYTQQTQILALRDCWDVKMEDLDRRIVALVDEGIRDRETVRMIGVEERERSQRWNERVVLETRRLKGEIESLRTQLSDKRRARQDLARSHAELRTLTNGLVQTVGDLRDDLARLTHRVMICQSPRSFPFFFSHPLS